MTQDTCSNVSSPRWFHRARLLEAPPTAMQLWEMAIRFTLNLLIITILVGLVGGVVKTFMDLRLLLSTDLEVALRHIIVDTLTILAVVEVLKTTLTYCSDGRVRVTFIVDTGPGGHVDRDHFSLVLRRRMAAIRSARRPVDHIGSRSGRRRAV